MSGPDRERLKAAYDWASRWILVVTCALIVGSVLAQATTVCAGQRVAYLFEDRVRALVTFACFAWAGHEWGRRPKRGEDEADE